VTGFGAKRFDHAEVIDSYDCRLFRPTRDQAREIVKSSIAAFISPDYVNPTAADSLTASGYIRAGIDTQTINVTAIPATGRDADSRSRSGYGFLLNDRGTIGYDPTPDEIWKYVLKRANQVGKRFESRVGVRGACLLPGPVGQVSASKLLQ